MKAGGQPARRSQAGTTILEVMIAVTILTIVGVSLLGIFGSSIAQNKQQGEVATRTTEYGQDKMEQLLALQFSDTVSNTATIPWSPVTYSASYAVWSSATSYSSGTNVNYNSTSYVSNISSNLNITPGTTTSPSGGTGMSTGGGTNASSPVTGYVDYLDASGNPLGTTSTGAFYVRVWQIATSGNLKTITVVATSLNNDYGGPAPTTTVVSIKANF